MLSRAAVRQLKVAALRAALTARGVQTAAELTALRRPALAALLEEHEARRRAAVAGAPTGAAGAAGPSAAVAASRAAAVAPAVAVAPAIPPSSTLAPAPAVAPVTARYGDARDAPARTTLVLAPLSVLSAWEAQLADLVTPGVLRVAVYHGAGRTTDVAALAENDVIIASYGTLAAEWSPDAADDAAAGGRPPARKKRRSGGAAAHAGVLARVPLRRLVLDEAHVLRNGDKTRLFKAVMALDAPLRWALTGTPVVNRADDLQPLLAWLRVVPLESRRVWNRAIAWPLQAVGDETGLARLRTVVGSLCLRRTRAAVPALAALLPPATTEVVTLRMTGPQRAAYDLLFTAARRVFRTALGGHLRSGGAVAPGDGDGERAAAAAGAGGGEPPSAAAGAGAAVSNGDAAATAAAGVLGAHFSSILEVITRLRQICAAPALLPPARLQRARAVLAHLDRLEAAAAAAGKAADGDGAAALSPAAVTQLFAMLAGAVADADRRDCAVCMEAVTDESARILTHCRHTFCEACLATLLRLGRGAGVCPLCRGEFRGRDITSLGQLRECGAAEEEDVGGGDATEPGPVAGGKGDGDTGGDGGSGCGDSGSVGGDGGSAGVDADAAAAADTGAKAAAILAMLTTTPPDEKTVVFSQFTSFLDLLERSLAAAGSRRGVQYVRLDGSVSRPARAAALQRLRDAPGCRLLLASLTTGGVGVSLVAANRVILADPWWNAAAEAQAADRVCRLGQRRPVTVVKLVMESSVEAAMVDLQAAKAAVAQGALGRLSPAQARQAHARRLLRLFA